MADPVRYAVALARALLSFANCGDEADRRVRLARNVLARYAKPKLKAKRKRNYCLGSQSLVVESFRSKMLPSQARCQWCRRCFTVEGEGGRLPTHVVSPKKKNERGFKEYP